MSTAELMVYTLRPDGTAIYLPDLMAESLGLKHGAQIPPEVYSGHEIQGLIARRLAAEKGRNR